MTESPIQETAAFSTDFDHHRGRRPLLRETGRFRGFFFVTCNLVAFVVINAFLYYLSTGSWLDFSAGSYRRALNQPLGEMLLQPLSIFSHPWMILVSGLLISAVLFVPVIVAVLYRLWVSAVFVAIVAVVAHAPLLAVFLLLGALLAGMTRLRSNMPFMALLIGLAPLVAYLYFFCLPPDRLITPLQKLVLYMPLLLALVACLVAAVVALSLARWTQYRPGVVWPAVLVCLAAPMGIFYYEVGPAEFEYALIAARVGSGEGVFRPQKLEEFRQEYPATRPADKKPQAVLLAAQADLTRRRERLMGQCDRYLRDYPSSEHVPAVLWVRAAVQDVYLDEQSVDEKTLRYQWRGPSAAALLAWGDLAERCPDSPQGMLAHEKLAIAAAREGRLAAAIEHLHITRSLLTAWADRKKPEPPEGFWDRVFLHQDDVPGPEYCREVVAESGSILWLIESNNVGAGDARTDAAFAALMKLWPFQDLSTDSLAPLACDCANTELLDNVHLLQAMAEKDDFKRAAALAALAGETCDSAIQANYELGRLALRLSGNPAWQAMGLKDAAYYLGIVCGAPDNPYKAAAEDMRSGMPGRKEPRP